MKSGNSPESQSLRTLSRRTFLSASAAATAILLLDRRAVAATENGEAEATISGAALDRATHRAEELVKQMSLEEVTGQLVHNAPAIPRLNLAKYNYWSEALHGVNVNGPITSFPQPIALGCAWNPALVHRVYTAVSDEARAFHNKTGYGLTFFSPATVNMGLRDPRWGRVSENFSEDPLLVQKLAVQAVFGMQGNHPDYLKTVACAKHFICNETDSDRDRANAVPDVRSFWEYYTRGFETCVTEGKVFSVMSAYNALWGTPCPASHLLLDEILRKRWGFKGYVVTDCDAVSDIYKTHHFVQTGPEAAALAIKAGSDLNCGDTYSRHLLEACSSKLITEDLLRQALVRVLTGRVLLGEFDPPATVPWHNLSAEILEGQQNRDLAREAARQSLVLLKNQNGLLPLNKKTLKKIAVIGPMAGSCHLAGYSGRPTWPISPYAGIANAFGVKPFSDFVPAGEYISSSNFRGPVVSFSDDGSPFLTSIKQNGWAQYGPLDFTAKTSIQFNLSSNEDCDLLVYLDSLEGKPRITIAIPGTGGLDRWKAIEASLSGISGQHVVFLKFASKTRDFAANLQWLKLAPASQPQPSSVQITYAPGCTITGEKNNALFDSAVQAAKDSDAALVFVGINRLLSDEGRDREFLHLPGVQHELVKAVVAANPRTVVIVVANCPPAINWEKDHAPAILCAFAAGEQQGNAIADALFGDYNPGGKLSSTWFRDESQLPDFHDYDLKHGRTYMYFKGEPLYPFGYGLSYTTFSYGNLQVSGTRLAANGSVTVSADISNTGSVSGDEVVQFYVQAPGSHVRPGQQLAGFERIALRPGEKKKVKFVLPHGHLALQHWDEKGSDFVCEPGTVQLLVGAASTDIRLRGSVSLI
jgi:beta-glucosidase